MEDMFLKSGKRDHKKEFGILQALGACHRKHGMICSLEVSLDARFIIISAERSSLYHTAQTKIPYS